ncbi:putative bifunctional diguanylate cyclase/phosphodiesterase, partial [Kocuria rosea]|uniref:putative bifunctional diguanylate cyclase/phosphodiesterase n=1 Tax=Kocuria rosea TaxID=1275 RepID=UPI000D669E9D
LTDLPNRSAFLQALTQMIEACDGTDEEFAVLCVDLDGLKEINDVYGHAMGDKVLIEVAQRLQAVARGGVVARLSGDEFGLIIDGRQPVAGIALAEQAGEALGQDFLIDGKSVRTGLTTGIAVFPHNGSDAASLLANSVAALFRAKAKSRGTISIFEPEMDQQIRDRRVLHQELSVAIKNGELSLYYQPQAVAGASVAGSQIIGFEALARWNHGLRGLIAPNNFIPVAEETGLIVPLGEIVLRKACFEAAGWPADIAVAVNLSPVQFKNPNLVSSVRAALDASGLSPDRLELEITESVLLQNSEATLAVLHELRGFGVRISLDDFGTGYSSLSYLRSFPFDKIKIDKSFTQNMTTRADCAAIVQSTLVLAQGLGMHTTAEGVETDEQYRLLRLAGATSLQGYLFSRARPLCEIDFDVTHERQGIEDAA